MQQNNRRNFMKVCAKFSSILFTSVFFLNNKNIKQKFILLKRKIKKRKYSKVWILGINDS